MSGGRRPTADQFEMQLQHMIDSLRSEIAAGHYAAGSFLPSEKQLAVRFSLGNNSVRRGLEQLVAEHWIEKIPRVGNRVCIREDTRQRVTLTLLCRGTTELNLDLTAVIALFQQQYPWIEVKVERLRNRNEEPDIGDHTPFDVVLMDDVQLNELVENNQTHLLRPLDEIGDVYPVLQEMSTRNGTVWMQPLIFSPIVLCYNKAHFREIGLAEPDGSWTWDDLIHAAERLHREKGRYGFCFPVQHLNRWPVFLLQSGETFPWDADGRMQTLQGTRLKDSMDVPKAIIQNRHVFPMMLFQSNLDTLRLFYEGKLSMILDSYMGLNLRKDHELEYDISPIPFLDEPRTLVICLGAAIARQTAYPKEAELLLSFLSSPMIQSHIQHRTLSLPAKRQLPPLKRKAAIARPDRYTLYKEILFSCRSLHTLQLPMAGLQLLFQELNAYWADLIDEETLDQRLQHVLQRSYNEPQVTTSH